MRIRNRTATVVLTLATGLCLGSVGTASAPAASTGGSSAPAAGTPAAHLSVRANAIATWYGPGFFGSETACGQTLTRQVIGVANRTLPCGTLVKITYRGRSIVAPVLDRGPYSHIGADWDLTAGAAAALGVTETVRIGTRIVGSAPNTRSLGLPTASAARTVAGGVQAG